MSSLANTTATPVKQPIKGSKSWSRTTLLVASGLFTVAVFLLDAQALQVQQLTSSSEFAVYVVGVVTTYLYVSFVLKGRRVRSGEADVQVSAADAARAFLRKAKSGFEMLQKKMQCPRPTGPRPTEEKPPVPFWALAATYTVLCLVAIALFAAPFLAEPTSCEGPDADSVTFLDAPIRGDMDASIGKGLRNWTWLVTAFALSSGLCVVHPLQSGLILGF